MKFSFEWLRELSQTKLKPEQVAELLSEHTCEAELTSSLSFKNIIVAKVVKVDKHPNADRLRVVELTDGNKTYAPVVCGAWNFEAGAIVPLALPGAVIPHDQHDPEGKPFTLGKATIRGIESQGMICSAKELGLSNDGKGILLLDESEDLGSEFKVGNEVLDVSSFANRPDLHSYLGVAMEIAALTGSKLQTPKTAKTPKIDKKLTITIKNQDLCSHYSAIRLSGVEVGESPEFIQKRLKDSGLRPINNIVDITNYVMLLVGQPMHAFDASKIDSEIIVRKSDANEKITTLDNIERTLNKGTLLITDKTKPIAIAGIIGGANSAVNKDTQEVILEVANFDAVSIRKSSRYLNLRTDASSRFEKSIPVSFVPLAIQFALVLLSEYANAKVVSYSVAGKLPEKEKVLSVSSKQINELLGMDVPAAEQKKILEKFGFTVTGANSMKVTVPSWRSDVNIWEDLAEEVVRYKGLDQVPTIAPIITPSAQYSDEAVMFRDKLSDALTRMGLSEIYTYSFTPNSDQASLEIANPLTEDQKFLRTGILPNMTKIAVSNSRYFDSGTYFEIGDVYRKGSGGYVENTKLGLIAYDKKEFPSALLNGIISNLSRVLNSRVEFIQTSESNADVLVNGKAVGFIETIPHADVKIVGASLDLQSLINHSKQKQFIPLNRFPSKSLDTSLLVDEKVTWAEILRVIGKDNQLIKGSEVIDVYKGKGIPSGKKSLTIRITYSAKDRTLTDQETTTLHQQIIDKIANKFKANIRN